ncbi:BnaA06g38710D [Brassica napus]|uniref:BnaA06g38710D protein n=1 Tax=Brassica napus TaxID=3708 RepID=A0A078J3J7_BRANA|nr:BnaA06g38710D [Brassica napus]
MDPNQTVGTTTSRVNDINPTGSDSGTKTLPAGTTGADGAIRTTQTQRIPPIGISSQDRFSPIDRTSIPDRISIPERARARVLNPPQRSKAPDLGATREKLTTTPQQGMTHRSLSYNGLDEIDTRLQGPRSTPIQSQNRCTGRPGEPRTRIQMPSHPTSENLTPSATGTFHQTGFDDPIGQARGYDLRRPIDVDLQREDPVIQNYIERNDAEL